MTLCVYEGSNVQGSGDTLRIEPGEAYLELPPKFDRAISSWDAINGSDCGF